jgi:large subunit ribosomal protein L6
MSRIGKNPVILPKGVTADISGKTIKVKGPKGELSMVVHDLVGAKMEDAEGGAKQVRFEALSNEKTARQLWPTMRSNMKNMVEGVEKGYTKNLEIQGVGYRANMQGKDLVLALGFSHEVRFPVPAGITLTVDKQTKITITGIDKQLVGLTAAKIKGFKPPEPYKGKGIRYEGQFVLRKEGKKK